MKITNKSYYVLRLISLGVNSFNDLKVKTRLSEDELISCVNELTEFVDSTSISPKENPELLINKEGTIFLESEKAKRFKFYLPIIVSSALSVVAIIISIISLLR